MSALKVLYGKVLGGNAEAFGKSKVINSVTFHTVCFVPSISLVWFHIGDRLMMYDRLLIRYEVVLVLVGLYLLALKR